MKFNWYKTEQHRLTTLKIYERMVTSLSCNVRSDMLATNYGDTHVLKLTEANKPPLILLHGTNACAPMVLSSYLFLREKYSLYAIDILGEPNKSDCVRLSKKSEELGNWVKQIILHYGLNQVSLAGISYGGYIAVKTALLDNKNIKQLFLISPAGFVNGNPLHFFKQVYWPMYNYRKFAREKYLRVLYNALFTDKDRLFNAYLGTVVKGFKGDMTLTPVFNPKTLKGLKIPVHLVVSELDVLFPNKKLIRKAKKRIPNLKTVLLLPKQKHVRGKLSDWEVKQVFFNSI